MRFLKKFKAPTEIKILLGVLEEAAYKLNVKKDSTLVKSNVEDAIFARQKEFVDQIRKGADPRIIVYDLICQITANHCCFGPYAFFGVLSTEGKAIHRIFEQSIDELVDLDKLKAPEAASTKKIIKEAIAAR